MATTKSMAVSDLSLDLNNFRTPPQANELEAVRAMVSVNRDEFWALMESLLDDGFHATENILVQKGGGTKPKYEVKEGNRRIAALKVALGELKLKGIDATPEMEDRLKKVTAAWKKENAKVPCRIYTAAESSAVDRIVALTHGKGEKAGRTPWNPVARARHNRDMSGASEPGLDLLEKYLQSASNLTKHQAALWGGDYLLSVLDEAIKRVAPRIGFASARTLADAYPTKVKAAHRTALERLLHDIGQKTVSFNHLRTDEADVLSTKYGFPQLPTPKSATGSKSSKTAGNTSAAKGGKGAHGTTARGSASGKTVAISLDDPASVMRRLRSLQILGNGRDKVVTLRNEIVTLNLPKHPHAFCFLLRSMFEISAKAYCDEHKANNLTTKKKDGTDKHLVTILDEITKHLIKQPQSVLGTPQDAKKILHGAMAELGKPQGLLSVTSMNQLVHNPQFSVKASDICPLFARVVPLLEAMNS